MNSLLQQALQANFYFQPILFLLIISTNLLNLRVLSSQFLRSYPCTHYFMAYAIFSMAYSAFVCPTQFLRSYSIDWAQQPFGCKLHFYFLFVIPVEAKLMLLFASFDRYYSSRRSRRFNGSSKIRTVRIMIVIGTILVAIYMSPMLFIYSWNEKTKRCDSLTHPIVHAYVFSQILFYYFISPCFMIVFGILTINNIRRLSIRAKLMRSRNSRRRTEGQLARMLLIQVGTHLILSLPFGLTYFINAIDPSTRTSSVLGIRYILILMAQCDYFVSFFLYFLSASIYREELSRIWKSQSCDRRTYHSQSSNQQCINETNKDSYMTIKCPH